VSNLHVICKVAGAEYAIPASEVMEMENFSGVTPMPGAPAFVVGLVQVRSRVIPVIDARVRFGLEAITPGPDARLVVLSTAGRVVALLVDAAREVREIAPEQFAEAPGVLSGAGGFVKAVAQLKERIILLLDSLKIVGEENTHG
jgi:purine-binding chemotaxis protein CheW